MNLTHLRERTRPEHEATESQMSLMSADLGLGQYVEALRGLHRALAPWETYAADHAPEGLAEFMADRRRSPLLERDLADLHASENEAPQQFSAARIPGLTSPDSSHSLAAFCGALYVVEGSSLGGQYISRHVQGTLGLTAEHGASYFRGYGERTGALWAEVRSLLGGLPDADEDRVVAAAKAMFGLFAEALATVKTLPQRPAMASVSVG